MPRNRFAHRLFPLFAVIAASLAFAGEASADDQDKGGPPFAGDPDKPKIAPKPKVRTWNVVKGAFTFSFRFEPGIPSKDQVVTINIVANEKPETPDPKYGTRAPLGGAKFVGVISNPAGQVIRRYLAHPEPLAPGRYAFHFTPMEEGLHGLELKGRLKDGRKVSVSLEIPVDVWPLPKKLEGSGDVAASGRRPIIRGPIKAQ